MRKLIFILIFCFCTLSNSYSEFQSSILDENNKILGLKSTNIDYKTENLIDKDTIIKSKIVNIPQQHFGRFVRQYIEGIGLGSLFFVAVALPLALTDRDFSFAEGHSNGMFTVALIAGSAALVTGNILGVWDAGNSEGFSASPFWTAAGALAGVPVGILTGIGVYKLIEKYNNGWYTFGSIMSGMSMITIGSIIGFNATRTYNPNISSGGNSSLITFQNSNLHVSNPGIYIISDKTRFKKPITYLNILNINF